ncbi:hypothetical protein TcWFU_010032 [Taenia crassiceps]|uniref:Selenoprotein F/M domain-containing protein n=1 Tax=Taenia crassiceps TaxID=6207 RepID=A0ABR4QJ02_9CEST
MFIRIQSTRLQEKEGWDEGSTKPIILAAASVDLLLMKNDVGFEGWLETTTSNCSTSRLRSLFLTTEHEVARRFCVRVHRVRRSLRTKPIRIESSERIVPHLLRRWTHSIRFKSMLRRYPQVKAFVEKISEFPNVQFIAKSGHPPTAVLMNYEGGEAQESYAIETWDTDTIRDFFRPFVGPITRPMLFICCSNVCCDRLRPYY